MFAASLKRNLNRKCCRDTAQLSVFNFNYLKKKLAHNLNKYQEILAK